MKNTILLFLLSIPVLVFADTFGPDNKLVWDYSAEQQARIQDFRLFVNGQRSAIIPASGREILLRDAGVVEGHNVARIRAFDGENVSDWSNEAEFDYVVGPVPLAVPSDLRVE